MPNLKLDAALAYTKRGWSVIPCYPNGKKPRGEWKQYQTQKRTESELREHWAKYPDDNVGIVTGGISGISGVDVDGPKGVESLAALPSSLPETRYHVTPHGTHYIYEYEPTLYTAAGFLPGLDVRNDGGFIVAPPSVIDGVQYEVGPTKKVNPIGEPPTELVDRRAVKETKTDTEERPNWVSDALDNGAPEGQRNQTAARLAGYFFSRGMPEDIVLSLLASFGDHCEPPMDIMELTTVVTSTERYHTIEENHEGIRGSVYTWPEKGIQLTVENLRRTMDGCKCVLRITREDGSNILAPSGVDMLSVSSRNSLIGALKERLPDVEWSNIIETLCYKIIERMSEGEAMVDLKDHTDSAISKWLLQPFILGDGATILFGQGGLGKSMLALGSMLTLDTGLGIVGHTERTTGTHKGLYLDWEDSANTQGERFAMLLKGVGKNPNNYTMMYQSCSAPLHDIISTLAERIKEHGITYLVIDSAALACGGAPDTSDAALNFFNALKRLQVPSLIIAHQTKDTSRPYPFGSIFWHNSARCTWEIKSSSEPGQETIPILLVNHKSNRGKKHSRIGLDMLFNERDNLISIKTRNASEVAAEHGAEGASVKEQVYAAIKRAKTPLTVDSLASYLDITKASIAVMLDRDQKNPNQKYFVKTGQAGRADLWGIAQRH